MPIRWVCIAGKEEVSSGESSDCSVQSPEKPPAPPAADRRRSGGGGGVSSQRNSTELQSGQYQSGNETSTSTVMSGQSGRGRDPTWLSYKSLLGIRTKGRKRSDSNRSNNSNNSKGQQQKRFMFRSTDPDAEGGEVRSDSDNSERGGYSSSLGALTPRALPADWRRTFHSAVRASYHYVRGDRLAAPVRQVRPFSLSLSSPAPSRRMGTMWFGVGVSELVSTQLGCRAQPGAHQPPQGSSTDYGVHGAVFVHRRASARTWRWW